MPSRKPWFRLYSRLINDPKIRSLSDGEFRLYIGLLCLASENKRRGYVELDKDIPWPLPQLGKAIGVHELEGDEAPGYSEGWIPPGDLCREMLGKLGSLHLVTLIEDGTIWFHKWDELQFDNPSDQPQLVATRVSKHRALKASNVTTLKRGCNEDVTIQSQNQSQNKVPPIVPLILPEEWNENVKEGAKILLSMPAFFALAQKDRAWFIDGFNRFRERLGDRDAKEVRVELYKFSEWWVASALEGKPMKKPWAALTNWFFKVKR